MAGAGGGRSGVWAGAGVWQGWAGEGGRHHVARILAPDMTKAAPFWTRLLPFRQEATPQGAPRNSEIVFGGDGPAGCGMKRDRVGFQRRISAYGQPHDTSGQNDPVDGNGPILIRTERFEKVQHWFSL